MLKKQQGNVSIIVLMLFVAIGLSVVTMYDSGQTVNNKLRLQDTADAVAFSSAIVASRELNFMAYTNRAMISNQVAIGQWVGLVSWTEWLEVTATNLNTVGQFIPFVNAITAALEAASIYINEAIHYFIEVAIPALDIANIALSKAQIIMHNSMLAMLKDTYGEVIKANDPDVNYSLTATDYPVSVAKFAQSMQEHYNKMERFSEASSSAQSDSETKELKRFQEFAQTTRDSRDKFTTNRSNDNWLAIVDIPDWLAFIKFPKYGGNQYDAVDIDGKYVWEWTSMDTLSMAMKKPGPFKSTKHFPIGWGAAHNLNKDQSSDTYDYDEVQGGSSDSGYSSACSDSNHKKKWGGTWQSCYASRLANSEFDDNNLPEYSSLGHSGMQAFYGLKKDGIGILGPEFLVVLVKEGNKVPSFKKMAHNQAINNNDNHTFNVEQQGFLSGDGNMAEIAKAEPYFHRPTGAAFQRGDDNHEYANLYNPYWQARLAKVGEAESLALTEALRIQ